MEAGGDGPPLHQGGAGRRRPPVDGRGDGDSVVNPAGAGPGGSRATGQETGRDPGFRLISRPPAKSRPPRDRSPFQTSEFLRLT